jgi:flagellar motor switch protein FliN/FliY
MTAEITPAQADRALAAAGAAAQVLPAAEPLTAAGAQAGTEHVTSAFAGAAVADLEPAGTGRIAVLVAADLVEALASSPLGGLDLAAATQPALDAAAAALNLTASAAREVDLALVVSDLGEFTAVPLVGTGFAAAVLISNDALVGDAEVPVHASVDAASMPTPAAPMATPPLSPVTAGAVVVTPPRGIEMLHGVDMEVTVELGRTRMTVRDLLALAPGTVLELDRAAGSPADLLVNGRLIARGEVVVLDEDFGLRVTEIVDEAAAS